MADHTWRIEMMGGLRLCCGAHEITHFKSRKVAALVSYLAFYASRHHNREELQALLWPDDSLDAARNSLRVSLSLLRRQLEPDGIPTGAVLHADRYAVWLDLEAVSTDTGDFDCMYAAAVHTEDEAAQSELLKRVVDAYHGDLLSGLYEEWVLTERARLSETYLQALRKLVRALAATREYEIALEYARRAVQLDPLREEAARDLMRVFLAVHQPSAALKQYKELEHRLKEAFQSRPSAATRDLARRIAEGLDHGGVSGSSSPPDAHPASAAPQLHPPKIDSAASPSRIPVPLTRFFGRENELARPREWASEIAEGADDGKDKPKSRLITLTGPGGMGKSRLAMQTAEVVHAQWRDRIWFVPLADVADANHIADAIAAALQVVVSDRSGMAARIAARLNGAPSILILDNLEHLLEGGTPLIRMLLEEAPKLAIMVTSRRALGLPGEREFPVPPLPVPVSLEAETTELRSRTHTSPSSAPSTRAFASQEVIGLLKECEAVQLFVDRAQAVDPRFCITANNAPAVSALCRQLEGLPLALELAAARIRVLSPDQMLAYVGRRLDLLVDPNADKDGRHRSLRAAIEWSYRLLSPDERRLFARLSVFEGGCTLAAALNICGDAETLEAMEQLRMGSLVQTEVMGAEARFRMLETLRSFAAEQLSVADESCIRQKHAQYYLALAEEAEPNVKGPDEAIWMDMLQLEHDNFRAALNWYLDDPGGGESGLRLVRALWRFWIGRGFLTEGRERIGAALAHPDAQEITIHRARALMYGGDLANSQSDFAGAESLLDRSLAVFRSLDNRSGIANALSRLGLVKMRSGHYDDSRRLQEESLALFENTGDSEGIATSSSYLGLLAITQGDYLLARRCNERCLGIYRDMGNRRNLATTLGNLGLIAEHLGEYAAARGLQEESLSIHRELGTQQGIAASLSNLAVILIKLGEHDSGRKRLLEGMALFCKLGNKHSAVISLETLGGLAVTQEEWALATWFYGVADGARKTLGAAQAPRDQEERERDFAVLRDRLGDEAFYLEFTKGRATSLEQAIEKVLANTSGQ